MFLSRKTHKSNITEPHPPVSAGYTHMTTGVNAQRHSQAFQNCCAISLLSYKDKLGFLSLPNNTTQSTLFLFMTEEWRTKSTLNRKWINGFRISGYFQYGAYMAFLTVILFDKNSCYRPENYKLNWPYVCRNHTIYTYNEHHKTFFDNS